MALENINIYTTFFKDVLVLTPQKFIDERGYFIESFNLHIFNNILKKYNNCCQNINFVQDNHSLSKFGVLRGLHYQIKHAQHKLVRVIKGSALDIIVDIRKYSPTFGKYFSIELSQENNKQLWIPAGFAHGFLALSDEVEFLYKTSDYRYSEYERSILWNDKTLNIDWKLDKLNNINNLNNFTTKIPILSDKDANADRFLHAEVYNTKEDINA